jgi:hypothetical protein
MGSDFSWTPVCPKQMGWEGVDWIFLVQDRHHCWDLLNIVMNLLVPQNAVL